MPNKRCSWHHRKQSSLNGRLSVGGAKNSLHLYLEDSAAIDFTTGSVVNNRAVYLRLKAFGEFDELILEKGGRWIHIGWKNVHGDVYAAKAW